MCAVQSVGTHRLSGMVVIDCGIDEVSVQRRTDIAGQRIGDDQVCALKSAKWIMHVGAKRGVKRVEHGPAGREQHLIYTQVRILAREGSIRRGETGAYVGA